MNIQAEKLKLIEWLAGLTDATLIERIKFLKENPSVQIDWWEDISETEKQAIDAGLADAENGNLTDHQKARKCY